MKINFNGVTFFASLLTIVFVVLKLTNFIDWRWLWVLSPIWISGLVSLLIMAIVTIIMIWRF